MRGALSVAARPLLAGLARSFAPNTSLVVGSEAALAADLGAIVPWARGKTTRNQRPTAYVCEHGACKLPTTDPARFALQLAEARPL